MIENIGNHYVYRHIRKDTGEPFYIGIGTKSDKQSEYHRANSKHKRNDFWKSVVNKADYEVEILLESNDYDFIKQKEIEFIALYGRRDLGKGTLVNMTDGGDGVIGVIQTLESIDKRRVKLKGRKHTEETLEKQKRHRIIEKEERKQRLLNTEFKMKQGCTAKITDYFSHSEVFIIFLESGVERKSSMRELVLGRLKDYFYPSVCGIGYIGDEKVKKEVRDQWTTLLLNNKEKYGISKEWCNLQNFAKWYEENHKVNGSDRWVLRTNIFNKEPQECDPSNTYFLPMDLSQQLTKSKGYAVRKSGEISSNFLGKHLGYFKTIEEAKEKCNIVKKEYIIELADKYRNELPEDLYYKIIQHEIKFE